MAQELFGDSSRMSKLFASGKAAKNSFVRQGQVLIGINGISLAGLHFEHSLLLLRQVRGRILGCRLGISCYCMPEHNDFSVGALAG
jgi:hypothetical protein